MFDFLHDLLSAGVGQTLPLTLERHLAGQHGVLQTNPCRFVRFAPDDSAAFIAFWFSLCRDRQIHNVAEKLLPARRQCHLKVQDTTVAR